MFFKKFLLLLSGILLFSHFLCLAQSETDSLYHLLHKASGRQKVDIYNQLAYLYLKVSLDTASQYTEKALTESQILHYEGGIAHSYLNKASIYDAEGKYDEAKDVCEQSQAIFKKINDQKGMADTYHTFGIIHMNNLQYEEAISYLKNSLEIFHQLDDKNGQSAVYKSIGTVYVLQDKLDEALQLYTKGSKLSEEIGDDKITSSFYTNIGTVYQHKGHFEKALTFYYKSLALKGKLNDKYGQASIYSNIALIYNDQKNYENAMKYQRKSLLLDQEMGRKVEIAIDYNNLGAVHMNLGNYDSALYYNYKSLKIRGELDNKRDIAHSLENIGLVYKEKKEYEKAVEFYQQSLKINESLEDKRRISLNYRNLGEVYTQLRLYNEAEDYLKKSLAIREEMGDYFGTGLVHEALAALYELEKDPQQALDNFKKYIVVKDSFSNEAKHKQIAELQTKYETEKKEQELAVQKQQVTLLQQQQTIESFWRNILITGIIVLVIATYLVYRFQHLRNRRNQQLLEAQQALTKQLQDIGHMKSHFFANISHEFRTPLTLILGPLDALQQEVKQESSKRQLQVIQRSALRLLKLINQLLNLSKIEAGKLELKVSPQNVVPFLRGLFFSFHSLAEKKKILLDFESPEEGILVFFDAEKVEQIVTNLLSNAFKFTEANGKITLALQHAEWKGKSCLRIMVKDTGIGISNDQLPYIFDRFFQVDASDTKAHEGTGIGLALAKEFALLHQGDITVESEKEKGSTFYVYLPLGKEHLSEDEIMTISTEKPVATDLLTDPQRELMQADTSPIESKDEKQMILVVEDHPDLQDYIYSILSDEYQVIQAENGKEGWEKAQSCIPNLIISDVMMPKMNGIDLCKRLKNDIRTSHIPVVLLTAKNTEEDKLTGLESLADDYLTKPFNTRELTVRIKNLITLRQKMQEKFKGSVIIKPKDIEVSSMEQVFLEKLMQLLEENLSDEGFGVEQLSKEIGMSRTHLHRKLQALTNHAPSQFIRRFRLQRAMYLLQKKSGTIAEIAYTVGFSSPTYFTKCFVEQYGYPPKEVKAHQALS